MLGTDGELPVEIVNEGDDVEEATAPVGVVEPGAVVVVRLKSVSVTLKQGT